MFGAIAKSYYAEKIGIDPSDLIVVSIMPCLAKKYEASRPEFANDGVRDVDYVLSTRELASMIKEAGIVFDRLPDEQYDNPLGESTGAAVIFGASGGVLEAALRTVAGWLEGDKDSPIDFVAVRGPKASRKLRLRLPHRAEGIASGLECHKLLERIQRGETSITPLKSIAPVVASTVVDNLQPWHTAILRRVWAIYRADKGAHPQIHLNPSIVKIYEEYLGKPNSEKAHKLLIRTTTQSEGVSSRFTPERHLDRLAAEA